MSVIIKSGNSGNTANVDSSGNLQVVLATNPTITIGKVAIDQSTPGTSNGVQVNAPIPAGTNNIGAVTDQVATDAVPTLQNVRTPNVFKTASATAAGATAVWTPASGKKFRLMRFQIQLTDSAAMSAGSGDINIRFQDNTTDFGFQWDVTIPAAALSTPFGIGFDSDWIDLGNGYLSAAANNVLNFFIEGGNPLTAGKFRINVCGNEE